ncbi:MAG: LysR family hydrogen peroxide-inducible transcriptional activator [Ascidiaceihabitans sp.]|jgi:LysR family hydrogen peroxide-inducible transcriptional activator
MANFTLKQLRYFEAVARHGHFGRAAEACSISQPAISVQIKELEASLGTPLFERAARAVRLTSFGADFGLRVRDILRAVDALEDLSRTAKTGVLGRLRLGVIPTIAPYLLPKIIAHLGRTHAGLELHVRETMTERLIQELSDGLIDCAIVALPISEPTLEEVFLFEEDFVLIRALADADEPVPDADGLKKMRLLLLEEGHCFRDQALSFCNIRTALPREGLDGSSLSTLVQLVGSGIGVTLIPEMAVAVETRSARVSVARFSAPVPSRKVGMIWRKKSPLADQLLDISRGVAMAAKDT